jgi:abortive infection bacteriophage resistance protein
LSITKRYATDKQERDSLEERNSSPPVKEFFEYSRLSQQLVNRGMLINDIAYCERKLAQVGYYRLSGYWHSARTYSVENRILSFHNQFQPNTLFEDIFSFYLFDKRMRQEFMSAIERIEIFFRTIIAHELGRVTPLAYKDKSLFSSNAFCSSKKGPNFFEWTQRHERLLIESKEESITSHFKNEKPIPIWVAVEAWDFGLLSKFYSMLKDSYRDLICARAGINNREVLDNWLININGLRNRCAHHSRFCNRPNPRSFKILKNGYFNLLNLSSNELGKLFGAISVIWFLLKKIGPNSQWLVRIAELIDNKPTVTGFYFSSMGLPRDATEFPRLRFTGEFVNQQNITCSDEVTELENSHEYLIGLLENGCSLIKPEGDISFSERLLSLAEYYENQEYNKGE